MSISIKIYNFFVYSNRLECGNEIGKFIKPALIYWPSVASGPSRALLASHKRGHKGRHKQK